MRSFGRRVRTVTGPWREHRARGDSIRKTLHWVRVHRRDVLGADGWLPYKSYLLTDPKTRSYYSPSIKLYHWRGRRVWVDQKEIDRQGDEAHRRYEEFEALPPPAEPVQISDVDQAGVRGWAREMGWIE